MKAGLALRLLGMLAVLTSIGCVRAPAQWVKYDQHNRGAIVFVHGVMGDGRSTWTSPSGAYWPEMLTHDSDFDGQNIYVYHYRSPAGGQAFSIDQLADQMNLILATDKVLREQELTFVTHSMGGIVTRAFILRYRDVVPKIRLLYFFATPTTGSSYARIGALLSDNSQFGQILPMQQGADRTLATLESDWYAANFDFPSYCAYETQTLYGQIVVDQGSATLLCNRHIRPIDANHETIVKPSDQNSDSYRALKEAFEETEPASHAGKGNVPAPTKPAPPKPKIQIGVMLGADKGIGIDPVIDCTKPLYTCMSEEQAKSAEPIPLDVGAKGWARVVFVVKNVGSGKLLNSSIHVESPNPLSLEWAPLPNPSRMPRNVLEVGTNHEDIQPFSISKGASDVPIDVTVPLGLDQIQINIKVFGNNMAAHQVDFRFQVVRFPAQAIPRAECNSHAAEVLALGRTLEDERRKLYPEEPYSRTACWVESEFAKRGWDCEVEVTVSTGCSVNRGIVVEKGSNVGSITDAQICAADVGIDAFGSIDSIVRPVITGGRVEKYYCTTEYRKDFVTPTSSTPSP